ncbi:MAG: flagellar basal body rod protein FlgC [Clostridiales bacterium]|nr:flagellar basal body rod protein FlgC [Clostridiales bacterium]
MSLFKTMEISASGLTAQSLRMDVIAQNVANAETTRTAEGGPYQRKSVVLAQQEPSFAERLSQLEQGGQSSVSGVAVSSTQADQTPFQQLFDPNHPDADENGFVQMPNVDIAREYVDMIAATRAYEANITVMNASKRMALKALEMGR